MAAEDRRSATYESLAEKNAQHQHVAGVLSELTITLLEDGVDAFVLAYELDEAAKNVRNYR